MLGAADMKVQATIQSFAVTNCVCHRNKYFGNLSGNLERHGLSTAARIDIYSLNRSSSVLKSEIKAPTLKRASPTRTSTGSISD